MVQPKTNGHSIKWSPLNNSQTNWKSGTTMPAGELSRHLNINCTVDCPMITCQHLYLRWHIHRHFCHILSQKISCALNHIIYMFHLHINFCSKSGISRFKCYSTILFLSQYLFEYNIAIRNRPFEWIYYENIL